MEKKVLKEMFDNLLHIWNKTNYRSPKMKPYIYGSTNGVHIIDLLKTAKKVEEVKAEMEKLTWEGKKILFVSTKLQGRDMFAKLAKDTGNHYVCEKWIPGLLTNFKTIRVRINTYIKLLKDSESWAFDVLTKKEIAAKMLELEKLDKAFAWLKDMRKVPDIVFVVDWVYEKQTVKEAKSLKIPVYAILNSNGNPVDFTNIIPANTNAVASLEYIVSIIKGSFKVWVSAPRKNFIKKDNTRNVSWFKKPVAKTEAKAETPAVKKAPVADKTPAPKKVEADKKTTEEKTSK